MMIIAGLGNPGKKYEFTRHNIGFRIINNFAEENNFPEFKLYKKFNSLISESIINDKKIILINLAAIGDVDSFRTIESFNKSVSNELKDWAALALQESKVLLENSLLDEQRVIISTGLGGKENLLRYFVVLIKIDESEFEDYQKKIISDELDFVIAFPGGRGTENMIQLSKKHLGNEKVIIINSEAEGMNENT